MMKPTYFFLLSHLSRPSGTQAGITATRTINHTCWKNTLDQAPIIFICSRRSGKYSTLNRSHGLYIISSIIRAFKYRCIVETNGTRVPSRMNGYGRWIRVVETCIRRRRCEQAYDAKHVKAFLLYCSKLIEYISCDPVSITTKPLQQ